MSEYKDLPIPAEIYDEMGINADSPLQFDYDADSQTLYVHMLTEEELESLAGHCDVKCEDCLWVESCDEAHGDTGECEDFTAREDDW